MTFTLEDVLNAAREVVAEKGADYVYPNSIVGGGDGVCVYAGEDSAPSCLVGHVIYRLDPEAFLQVAEIEATEGTTAAGGLEEDGYLPEGFWDEEAQEAMVAAQASQDNGWPWGYALKEAGA